MYLLKKTGWSRFSTAGDEYLKQCVLQARLFPARIRNY